MTYTVARKADRTAMAKELVALVQQCGASVEQTDRCSIYPNTILLKIEAERGLFLNLRLDGKSANGDTHVLSWYVDGDAKLSHVFPNRNEYHYQKATDIAHGYESLKEILQARLLSARDGFAFQ